MYTVAPSGDATTERTTTADVPRVTSNTQLVGAPVAASNTANCARFRLAASPSAVPGGLIWVKDPPAKTLPWAAAILHTVPLVCQVGNASAVKCNDGANAAAGSTTHSDITSANAVP